MEPTESERERVRRGAERLDLYWQGEIPWRGEIVPGTLDVSSFGACPLGQLYGDFREGRLALNLDKQTTREYGFTCGQGMDPTECRCEALTQAWIDELKGALDGATTDGDRDGAG